MKQKEIQNSISSDDRGAAIVNCIQQMGERNLTQKEDSTQGLDNKIPLFYHFLGEIVKKYSDILNPELAKEFLENWLPVRELILGQIHDWILIIHWAKWHKNHLDLG